MIDVDAPFKEHEPKEGLKMAPEEFKMLGKWELKENNAQNIRPLVVPGIMNFTF